MKRPGDAPGPVRQAVRRVLGGFEQGIAAPLKPLTPGRRRGAGLP